MKVIGNAKYIRRVHGIYYRENFDDAEISEIEFQETKGRLTKGEWLGLVTISDRQLIASRFGVKDAYPTDGLEWNAVDADVKSQIRVSFTTKQLVPWLTKKLGRTPSIMEINEVVDNARGDIENLVRESFPWIG